MLIDLQGIFVKPFKVILHRPNLLIYSFVYTVVLKAVSLSSGDATASYALQCVAFVLSCIATYVFFVVANYYIFYVYKVEGIVDGDVDILKEARKYFWKSAFQYFAGLLVVGLISAPLLLVISALNKYSKPLFFMLLIFWLLLSELLFLGATAIGQRVLLRQKIGVVKSVTEGLKNLSLHQGWYFSLLVVYNVIVLFFFLFSGILGSALTDVNIFSVPLIPIAPFLGNYAQATSHQLVGLLGDIIIVFTFPYLNILITQAYLARDKNET